MKLLWKVVEPPPEHEFEDKAAGYCWCGSIEAVHEPHLTRIFDWMRRLP